MTMNKELTIPKFEINMITDRSTFKQKFDPQDDKTNWSHFLLNIPTIWTQTQGEGITVAVLDTGVDTDHADLKDAIAGTRDFSGDGIEDVNGHGTHCAGIIAARKNNIGFVGIAPQARLLIGKVLSNDGTGSFAAITEGINWAVENGAHIISMSLGGPYTTNQLFTALHNALSQGVMIICAAGNSGALYSNSIGYPGRYGSVITVASHDMNGNPSGFSSRGGEVDFMAPGEEIWSTYKNDQYATLSGTSMATPFVAGIAALIKSKHIITTNNNTPLENNEDLKIHLMMMASHPGYHDSERGYGPLLPFQYFGQLSNIGD